MDLWAKNFVIFEMSYFVNALSNQKLYAYVDELKWSFNIRFLGNFHFKSKLLQLKKTKFLPNGP